jgi:hypothetical protein
MKMSQVLEIIGKFKRSCRRHGWKTCENEDWVQTDEGFHSFLCARDIPSSSFKRVASERKCVVREAVTYRVVQASYTAWLFAQTPREDLVRIVIDNPDFNGRTALYDLSLLLEGEKTCPRINNTESSVFREFESFLKQNLDVRLEQLSGHSAPGTEPARDEISQVA